ncbi:MAG: Glu/Leu/Phe/Val dehydrogenase [Lactobacillus sp.]|jgi:glutamate dehydrogenase|nr:Glu/Leu/Phe/Val dehydrogenase [Lactobacillus sp.]
MMSENLNPLISAQKHIKNACDKLKLEASVYELLKNPQKIIEVSIPVKMDDGQIKVFTGYRSQHNNAIGPYKGGVRFHPEVSKDEVSALSIWMTLKCTITGVPYGGGKGGIIVDPKTLSQRELEELSRGYVRALYKEIGEKLDIPAPDMNTNGQIMSWMTDEYIKISGEANMGVFTGKPIGFGGSKGRTKATGLGVVITAREALNKLGISMQNTKAAVQGFGNVGSYTCKCFQDLGAKVVAIAEWNVILYNENGINIDELMSFSAQSKSIKGFAGAKEISADEFWALDVDVICPCAMENTITKDVADKIKAKLVVEGANGPTTIDADAELNKKGVTVIPDILANAGGVTVSYFEWVQNRYGYYWEEDEIETKQEIAMVNAFADVYNIKESYNVSMRDAAYMSSIKKIADTMKIRGWY